MNNSPNLFTLPEHTQEPIDANIGKTKPRLNSPVRNQIEFVSSCLDDLIPEDHQVRNIWNYVEQMDLSLISNKIQSTSNNPGRPAINPKVMLTLWIYALIEGIGSARVIDRYCSEHLAFKWICGGVSVNYHSISDFRKNHSEEFDQLITLTIARLMERDLVTLKRISQDGMRVHACAGSSSFRRKPKLKELLVVAKEQVEILRKEIDADSSGCLSRQMAAKKRAAEERKIRIEQAIEEHKKLIIEKGKTKKKHRKPFTAKEKEETRASITDPEARKMKMGNGGYSPAYNIQLAIDTKSRFIVGMDTIKKQSDSGQLLKMFDQLKMRYKKLAEEWLVDKGYLEFNDLIKTQKSGCKVYVNPSLKGKKDPNVARDKEDAELGEWRERMGTAEAKEIYKDRASNSEWANAGFRNRGLGQLLVRGLKAVKGVIGLQVLAHNMVRAIRLDYAW
jgi:transposase